MLTDIQAGWLATILLLSYAIWSPVIGYLADRFRRPRLMAIGIAIWSLATVGTGMARSYDQLQLARALVGIGGSTFGVIALTILMDLFPRGVRARVLSAYLPGDAPGRGAGAGRGLGDRPGHDLAHGVPARGSPWLVLALLALLPDPVQGHERRGRTATAEAP